MKKKNHKLRPLATRTDEKIIGPLVSSCEFIREIGFYVVIVDVFGIFGSSLLFVAKTTFLGNRGG